MITRFNGNSVVSATLIVRTLTGLMPELKRDGVDVNQIKKHHFIELFDILSTGNIAKEGVEDILRLMAKKPTLGVEDAVSQLGFAGTEPSEIESFVESIIAEKHEFISQKGISAVGPLMGIVMSEFRGKVDGKLVSSILKEKITEFLE